MRPSQPAMVDRLVHHAEVMSLQARLVDDNDNDSISQTPRGAQGCRVIGAALEVRAEAVGLAVVYSMPTPIYRLYYEPESTNGPRWLCGQERGAGAVIPLTMPCGPA